MSKKKVNTGRAPRQTRVPDLPVPRTQDRHRRGGEHVPRTRLGGVLVAGRGEEKASRKRGGL